MGNLMWGQAAKMPIEMILQMGPELKYTCDNKALAPNVLKTFK